MNYKIGYIKDIGGNNYLGINFYKDTVYPFLDKLKSYITDEDEYNEYIKYQQDRDRGHYHSTVINPMEFNKLVKDVKNIEIINKLINDIEIDDFKILGIGSSQKNNNKTYYIVCKSLLIQEIRKRFGLDEKDLHITIGFKYKDVHGVPKNEVLPEVHTFLSELSKYYYDFGSNFSFIKELENYDYDLNKTVYCTKLMPTYAEFKIGNEHGVTSFITVSMIDDRLKISCRWETSDEVPYLSNTIIQRKFNNE